MASLATAQAAAPIIDTVAGGGVPSGNGDGGPATSARLEYPVDVAIDAQGNLYIADSYAFRVRKVTPSGIVSTAAGNGTQIFNGDGIQATAAGMDVRSVAVDASGNLYIADLVNHRVRKVSPTGVITTVAGNGSAGHSGDGGPATAAAINPTKIEFGPSGALYIVDDLRIRKVDADGVIRAVAGTGEYGFGGDGGPATSAMFANPEGIAFDRAGNLYVADYGNDRIRRIAVDGKITTVAGGGHFRSDPVALSIYLLGPHGVAVDARGNLYIAERNNEIRVVNANGIVQNAVGLFNDSTFGNEGSPPGFSGDGGPASNALLREPMGLALDAQQNLYFADNGNARVRRVSTIPTPSTPVGLNAFGTFSNIAVGSFTKHVAIADVTGDGRADALLTTSSWSGDFVEPANDMKLWLFVQKTDGTLAPPLKYGFYGDAAGGRSGSGLATGDLNRDGFMDVVVGTLKGVTIYRGGPSGLATGVEVPGFENAEAVDSVAIMDVNADGKLDIVAFGGGGSAGGTSPTYKYGLTVYYGNGAGGVASKTFQARPDEYGWQNLRATDVNNDAVPDLTSAWTEVGTGNQHGGIEIALHNRVNALLATQRLMPFEPGYWGAAYAFGDFDWDGRKDVVVSKAGNAPDAAYTAFRQLADGRFVQSRQWKAFDRPDEMISADMNGDRRDDLLVVHAGWSSVGYFQQSAAGLETEIKYFTVQSGQVYTPSIAVGDLNGDDCKDIALADYNYGLVTLYGRNCLPDGKPKNGAHPFIPPRSGASLGEASGMRSDSERGRSPSESGNVRDWVPERVNAWMHSRVRIFGFRPVPIAIWSLLVLMFGYGSFIALRIGWRRLR